MMEILLFACCSMTLRKAGDGMADARKGDARDAAGVVVNAVFERDRRTPQSCRLWCRHEWLVFSEGPPTCFLGGKKRGLERAQAFGL
jgi:hypothetical protein